jgi:glutathione S-transferase
MSQPQLITFAISHYCEIARWALDWHDIDYRETGWAPGLHILRGKRIGARRGSVPMLITNGDVIEGSASIVSWACDHGLGNAPDISIADDEGIERRIDKGIGVNVRRLIYSHVLPDHAHVVKPLLLRNLGMVDRVAGQLMWPVTKKLIARSYRTTGKAREESAGILDAEMTWLEGRLQANGGHVTGGTFSRLDLAAASLLSPLALPREMAIYNDLHYPAGLNELVQGWSDRQALEWTRRIYATWRERRSA